MFLRKILFLVAVTIFTAIFVLWCLLGEGLTFIVYCMGKFCNNFLFTRLRPLCAATSIFYCLAEWSEWKMGESSWG